MRIKQMIVLAATGVLLWADNNTTELNTITVEGEGTGRYAPPADSFELPDYLKSDSYLENVPGQRQLTTKEALALPGVQGDPVKAVKFLAGVSSESSTSGELIIHAAKPRETVSSINHLPIGYLFHMGGLHSVIAPEATEQIDAYLGAYDVTYSGAMGGVLDITPKYPLGNGSGFVHMGIFDSSFGYDFSLGEKSAAYVGGRRSYFDLTVPKTGTLDNDTTYTIFPNYYDGTVILTHALDEKNFLSFESIKAHDTLKINTQANKKKDPLATGTVYADYGFTTTGLRWLYDNGSYRANTLISLLGSQQKMTLFDDYDVDIKQENYSLYHVSTYESGDHKINAGFEGNVMRIPLDLNVPVPPSDDDGTDVRLIDINDTVTSVKRTLDISWVVLFAQDIYRINDALRFRYGVNYSYTNYQEVGSYLDPRTALIWEAGERDVISLAYGCYTAFPDGVRTMKEFGSDTLGYERSVHYALGYKHTFENDSWLLLEPYYKEMFDLAIANESNVTNHYYKTAGEGYAHGIDMTYSYMKDDLYLYGVYSYVDSQREIDVDDSRMYPFYAEVPHTLQLAGSYKFGGGWTFSTLAKYTSGKPYTPIAGVAPVTREIDGVTVYTPIYGKTFSKRLPDYFTLNLKIAKEKLYPDDTRLEYSFELMNATNHQNALDLEYEDDYSDYEYIYDLPMLPWFDVTYRF